MKICHNRMSRSAMAALFLLITTNAYGQLQWSDQVFIQTLPQFERSVADQSRIEIPDGQASFGGGIVGQVGDDGLLTIFGSGQALVGVEFISESGLLIPVPSGADGTADASPFQLLLSNTQNQVTYGTLGDAVVIDGGVKLGVGYTGQFPLDDISAQWGRDTDAIAFPVGRQGVPFTTPFNLGPDGAPVNYSQAVFQATIEAGSAAGSPPDTPADRVDPNDGSAMFAGVGSLEIVHPTLGSFVCTGTVIDDTHVLTAAHCFDYDADGLPDTDITVDSKFYLNDGGSPSATIGISSVDLHPDFGGFTATGANDDLAVVTLDSVVPSGTTKYALRNTGMTSGEIVEMVGYGVSGQGDVGGFEILPDLSVKRSGKNTAELFVEDDEGSGDLEIFIYDFDGPTGDGFLGGGTLGNDVETVVRGGDSGGPTFVDEGGMKVIAGVNTFEFVLEPTTPGTGEFGVLGGGVIIGEAQFDWISSIATGATLVPEPSSVTLVLTMLSAVVMVRRRRR